MTRRAIKILHLEDNSFDTQKIEAELNGHDMQFERMVVNCKQHYTQALYNFSPDIVLSDYSLPNFSSFEALQILHKMKLHIPFILLTEDVTEDLAAKIMNMGADDYIIKDRLNRLPAAVINSIEKYRLENERKKLYNTVRENQKKTDEAIKLTNERYEFVAKVTSDMVWDWNLLTGEIYRSKEGWEKIFSTGTYSTAGSEKDLELRVHPDDVERVRQIKQQVLNSVDQQTFKIECRILNDQGNYITIEDNGYIMRNAEGKAIRLIGASKNISATKKYETELKKLSLVAQQTNNAVVITGIDQKIQWVNEAFTRITGYSKEEAIGRRPGDFMQGPETNKIVIRYMRMKIKKVQPYKCDILNYTKDGKQIWLHLECQPEFDNSGNLLGYFAIQTDITKEKIAEEALKLSEERHRYLFENNPASMFIWDIDTLQIIDANETAARIYGYSKKEFSTLSILELRRSEEVEKVKVLVERIKNNPGLLNVGIWKHITKKGEDIFMDIASHRIKFNGKYVILAMANNVTEKVLLQKSLESEKSAKQKEITDAVITAQEKEREQIGGELHDNVNQILASSLLYMAIAKRHMANPDILAETEKLISNAIKEIRILSHSLLPPSLEERSLKDALANIVKVVRKTSSFAIHDTLDCTDENNMPDKLKLSIYRIVQEQFNNIHKYAKAKNVYITLTCNQLETQLNIKDDGIGFDTSKKNEGVGLMNIKTRASLYNGKVTINASPNNGCELSIVFKKDVLQQFSVGDLQQQSFIN
jgi:PAS domain S-box-containing protein